MFLITQACKKIIKLMVLVKLFILCHLFQMLNYELVRFRTNFEINILTKFSRYSII